MSHGATNIMGPGIGEYFLLDGIGDIFCLKLLKNMVRVVKRSKTSDCDSDMRGFESHHAPQVKLNGLCQKLNDNGPNCWGSTLIQSR